MSRKKKAPKRISYPDAKYGSLILSKFVNFMMYDGKKAAAEKISIWLKANPKVINAISACALLIIAIAVAFFQ